VNEASVQSKWECRDGTPEEDHDWKEVHDWGGDPDVVHGTFNIDYLECRQCGKHIPIPDGYRGDDGSDYLHE